VQLALDDPQNYENAEKTSWNTHRNLAPLSLFDGALHAATWGAKLAMSQVYTSKSCRHKWRKWLQAESSAQTNN
jgi:hypothetical protein